MSRAERLLALMQILRKHRFPVSGEALAKELGISLRTLYRDIAALQNQGAKIAGEAGVGYLLRPGYTLPPLNFTEEEIEALVLGSRWVERRTDPRLAEAAGNALAKIGAVLPAERRDELELSALRIIPPMEDAADSVDLGAIRQALRQERKLSIQYLDQGGRPSKRVLWPVALGYSDRVRILAAWCELRKDFRHFQTNRIRKLEVLDSRYPAKRADLQREWRNQGGYKANP
ncbi:MAG TPA: YafY family protein [bacterium]|jgi:predicted DNA-binding transcriptional regulator YafY|nr:YafY family protein [bacterium]